MSGGTSTVIQREVKVAEDQIQRKRKTVATELETPHTEVKGRETKRYHPSLRCKKSHLMLPKVSLGQIWFGRSALRNISPPGEWDQTLTDCTIRNADFSTSRGNIYLLRVTVTGYVNCGQNDLHLFCVKASKKARFSCRDCCVLSPSGICARIDASRDLTLCSIIPPLYRTLTNLPVQGKLLLEEECRELFLIGATYVKGEIYFPSFGIVYVTSKRLLRRTKVSNGKLELISSEKMGQMIKDRDHQYQQTIRSLESE